MCLNSVCTLITVSLKIQTSGVHRIVWDGKNDDKKTVASGIYMYGMETGNSCTTHKMIMMK